MTVLELINGMPISQLVKIKSADETLIECGTIGDIVASSKYLYANTIKWAIDNDYIVIYLKSKSALEINIDIRHAISLGEFKDILNQISNTLNGIGFHDEDMLSCIGLLSIANGIDKTLVKLNIAQDR